MIYSLGVLVIGSMAMSFGQKEADGVYLTLVEEIRKELIPPSIDRGPQSASGEVELLKF